MSGEEHWNRVYSARQETALTWFEPTAEMSLKLVTAHTAPEQSVIDVGGGASRLVDGLLERGQARVAVLDLSHAALAASQHRLGQVAVAGVTARLGTVEDYAGAVTVGVFLARIGN